MATEQEIVRAIHSLFTETNPNTTALNSLNAVVQQLESKLGQDLTHKTDFIRAQIHLLFQPPPQQRTGNDHFAPQLSAYLPETPPAVISFSAQPSAPDKADASEPNKPPKDSVQTKAKRRGGPGGLNKLCGVSPELQAVVGHPALPRTEIVKQLWAYIRKNNLQDPSNKRKIVCNEELRLVFETDCTDMFKMNKLLAKHIIPLEPTKQPANKKKKADVVTTIRSAETGPYVVISDALVDLFGVGEKEMLQAEVLRRLWEYIKVNNLEDPLNPMLILCDAKLQDLFGCETITALGIPELLARHITRR